MFFCIQPSTTLGDAAMMKFFITGSAGRAGRLALCWDDPSGKREGAALVSWLTVAVLALTCVVYAAFCAAVVRAFFRTRVNRTAYRAAGAWAACFGVTLVGSLMALDTRGVDAAATFAACACLLSFPSCLLLERRWRNRDMAAAVAYLQLHRPAPRPATPAAAPGSEWGTGLDATCARLARSYDLTRREEDVLRLLMEGRTFAEAADELVVSLNTVKSHVRRIYAKMGVNGKADLLEKVSSAI